jgi:hypothetical protein
VPALSVTAEEQEDTEATLQQFAEALAPQITSLHCDRWSTDLFEPHLPLYAYHSGSHDVHSLLDLLPHPLTSLRTPSLWPHDSFHYMFRTGEHDLVGVEARLALSFLDRTPPLSSLAQLQQLRLPSYTPEAATDVLDELGAKCEERKIKLSFDEDPACEEDLDARFAPDFWRFVDATESMAPEVARIT